MNIRPHLQKLPLSEQSSFVARTYRTPNFEVGWHKHAEYELILFKEGSGMSFIGQHLGQFNKGDIYLLGSNLPHTFQKQGDQDTSAVVVQFHGEAFGVGFFDLPECQPIRQLLQASAVGLKLTKRLSSCLAPEINQMEQQSGFPRLVSLLNCLGHIASKAAYEPLNVMPFKPALSKDTRIDDVFHFTIAHFREQITLQQVADLAHLSQPAFCSWFKKVTKKTYFVFLNEIRINAACELLVTQPDPVNVIAYRCGFSHHSHFHKQFVKFKGLSPLQYKKAFFTRK